jgi:CDP-diacylglycerol--glycerol-3-phosphate 3-phosphatidyltransferase
VFDGNFRTSFEKGMAPIGRNLQQTGVSPDLVTGVGVAMAAACGVAIAMGRFPLAVLLLVLTGLPDAIDGAVAKAAGKAGPRGAFLDSVSDRVSDALLFLGAGWYLAGTDSPRMAILPFAVFVAASLVSYERAKAESLGYEARGGLMERAERFIVLGFGLLFSPLFVATLWVMLVLTVVTVVTRFAKVWRQASGKSPLRPVLARRGRRRKTRPMTDFRLRSQARAEARRRRRNL